MTRLPELRRGRPISITVDGERVRCFAGETVATAILTATPATAGACRRPCSIFCGIGICYQCVVQVDGIPGVRACVSEVRDGLEVRTASGRGGRA